MFACAVDSSVACASAPTGCSAALCDYRGRADAPGRTEPPTRDALKPASVPGTAPYDMPTETSLKGSFSKTQKRVSPPLCTVSLVGTIGVELARLSY